VSDLKDRLKDRIRRSSAHDQLIEPIGQVNDDVNKNVNVYVPPRVSRRPKFEDMYTRQTFYIENELLEQMNQLAGGEKGEKTRIINEALRAYLKRQ
jgi:uncharacterized protein (DUF4415 family)